MGLDSVELLYEWELFFDVKIPDHEAEKILSVQNAVECITSHIEFRKVDRNIKSELTASFTENLRNHGIIITKPGEQRIFELLKTEEEILWKELEAEIKLKLPRPKGKSRFERFLHNTFARDINYQDTTVERFVELTAAINYEKLLGTRCIQNKDEIMIGVMGITIDRLGLNPYEVYPNKRFVADFGIQ